MESWTLDHHQDKQQRRTTGSIAPLRGTPGRAKQNFASIAGCFSRSSPRYPTLQEGDMVVWGHLSAHKSAVAKKLVEATCLSAGQEGAALLHCQTNAKTTANTQDIVQTNA
jgi:hypothetical protein